jgi:pyruvate, water dikinase
VKILSWLDRIQPSDRSLIGEKAFALSQLRQDSYPILPGFIISAALFREFIDNLGDRVAIRTNSYKSSNLDVDNYQALQLTAIASRQAILQATLDEKWLSSILAASQQLQSPKLILRPSLSVPATVNRNLSGLMASQICEGNLQQLELAIKHIWAELFDAKNLFYWQRMGVGIEQINLAILVQPISNAIASGTAQIQSQSLQIQSNWGLGHSIVRGEVAPDTYQIGLKSGEIETQQLGNKIRAYRLRSHIDESNCLEPYLLSQSEQENYSLEEPLLEQLILSLQRLSSERDYRGILEWTFPQTSSKQTPQLYFNQINLPDLSPKKIAMANSEILLKGLSVSSGVAIAPAYIMKDNGHIATIPPGRILVAQQIHPDWLPWLKQVAGIVTEQGGITSHGAIIARELGIPAIVNATDALERVNTGDSIFLDGDKGEVRRYQGEKEPENFNQTQAKFLLQNSGFPYPIGTKLMVNLSQVSVLEKVASLPIDGVGLLRSEWMLSELLAQKLLSEWLDSQRSLLVQQIAQSIDEFAIAFAPRPIFYRSFDRQTSETETHLFLEQRGTHGYQLDPTFFELELQALSQAIASGSTNINLILPFVRTVEEFNFCRDRVEKAGLFAQNGFQLWIMAEVPSVIFQIPQFVRAGVQGIAIGSNDLTQWLFGIDRDRLESQQFNALHPALLAAIEQIIRLTKAEDIPCSICGQAPVLYPELIDRLIEWGIDSISVEPEAVERTYRAIARAEQRLLLKALGKER